MIFILYNKVLSDFGLITPFVFSVPQISSLRTLDIHKLEICGTLKKRLTQYIGQAIFNSNSLYFKTFKLLIKPIAPYLESKSYGD